MRRITLPCMLIFLAIALPSNVNGQENGPIIIPERLQELALKFPISERLNINWKDASNSDMGRYIGFLAATATLAEEIARKNDRQKPSDDDYVAAIGIQCIWPPNKPPLVEKYWEYGLPAFYSASVRDTLRAAVGPAAIALPAQLAKEGTIAPFARLPTVEEDYFSDVFNAQKLPGAQ